MTFQAQKFTIEMKVARSRFPVGPIRLRTAAPSRSLWRV